VKARPVNPPDPFADRPPQEEVSVDYSPRNQPEESAPPAPDAPPRSPSSDLETEPGATTDPAVTAAEPSSRFSLAPDPQDSVAPSKIETREVACFECGDSHPANILANSTQCRNCGRLIPMADREVRDTISSPIQTRGNIHIYKKGQVLAASIECHHLVIEGEFSGNAQCTGDLTIRRNGKIHGQVRCHRLRVERRAKVDFQGPVEMEEGFIDGVVSGNLSCRGLLVLEKKAVLNGNLKVGRLTVAEGAKHNGQVRMGAF
jgi:cytoskeletal protein CcmA (bactofilin family)